MAAPSETCHSRYCPFFVNDVGNCSDVHKTLGKYLRSTSLHFKMYEACCKLYCGEHSQTLQLQCQGTTQKMAYLIWFIVAVLVICALAQVFTIFLERGARKVSVVGAPLYLAFISVIVYLVTDNRGSFIYVNTPYYPIVGAMSVATFSYYFSSFQYSISLAHELAAATALVISMFPVWTLLTVQMNVLVTFDESTADDKGIRRMVVEVISMLLISLLWTLHSSVYRTIGYRAAWITAYNKEKKNGWRGDALRRMWILAGAQGHPTWRTPTGQSFGLYLALLAWSISMTIRNDLRCKDDLILFHLLVWGSPVFLTLAVLASQFTITLRASSKFQGENHNLLTTEFQLQRESYAQYTNAVISYRLGRDTWGVEEDHDVQMYRFIMCCKYFNWLDSAVATLASCGGTLLFALAYPGIVFLGILQWLIGKLIPESDHEPQESDQEAQESDQEPKRGGMCAWFPMHRRFALSEAEKIEAYRTLCENCLVDDSGVHYECSLKGDHKCKTRMHGLPFKVDDEVRKLFSHCRVIMLPLLLDNTGPSRLTYLLHQLVKEMAQSEEFARTANRDSEMAPLMTMRRLNTSRL